MDYLLITIAFWVGMALVGFLIDMVSKTIRYYKYCNRLAQLKPEIDRIDIDHAEQEFVQLQAQSIAMFERLAKKHKISPFKKAPTVDDYIYADKAAQRMGGTGSRQNK